MPGQAQGETPSGDAAGAEGRTRPWGEQARVPGTLQGLWVMHGGFPLPYGHLRHHGQTLAAAKTAARAGPGPPALTFLEGGHPGQRAGISLIFHVSSK